MKVSHSRPTKIVLADDHPIFLAGMRGLLEGVPDLAVVGEAATGGRALRLIAETQPDVAVLDVSMPEMHGIAVAKQLAAEASPVRVLMLSAHDDRTYVRQALGAGARGYILKRSAGACLLQAIRAVSGRGLYLDPAIAERFVVTGDHGASRARGRDDDTPPPLTEREREVIRLVAFGFTNKEVAGKLGITDKSVETYKSRASEKLDIGTRSKIVQYAILQGWMQNLHH
ncbi:Transcriptional regulatory protein DegU [Methylobacterium crusticola]|uniref:Transcriptional regulatory protein DegU n=1 Tax=Methylobacterium crusticola TaxID=1697972 RepID=A0ABQ4QZ94_9HYPH|nr:response regulator transcription factor [Methylobacterium crusticola]GJD50050.1 Transcriptional regulatory protein DegU [Methylobacterium crusticola]